MPCRCTAPAKTVVSNSSTTTNHRQNTTLRKSPSPSTTHRCTNYSWYNIFLVLTYSLPYAYGADVYLHHQMFCDTTNSHHHHHHHHPCHHLHHLGRPMVKREEDDTRKKDTFARGNPGYTQYVHFSTTDNLSRRSKKTGCVDHAPHPTSTNNDQSINQPTK